MADKIIYNERLTSNKTEALFLALMSLFFLLFNWRMIVANLDWLATVFLCFFAVFAFYSLNFRTLLIRLTSDSLNLTFGIFTWKVALDNIAEVSPDDQLPPLMKYGGAGIHFMMIRQRYRASFNFLEYPRVVIALKKKAGLVRDISFSTRQPDEVLRLVQKAAFTKSAA